ncbi:hypothetical protein CBR_g34326 [Chara braunii]|uniref:Uncharacterized protein n=1 Tax=Chara braunii TaxID=69332 RepID=A0A388LIE1_CHABU|nr:hypothetical protein CBR_g34326 [Chara braunii]|eukprot:GBG82047.1 hypothetical protein CBR_g34326 [Chara braunii]
MEAAAGVHIPASGVESTTFIEVPESHPPNEPSETEAARSDPQSLLRLYGSTVQEIDRHGQSVLTIVIGFATIAAAVLAVTPTSWFLKDYDDMCCTKVDTSGRCCFGVEERLRAPCCNTTAGREQIYVVQWASGNWSDTRCRVAQSAVLFRRSGKAIFLCLGIATAAVAFYVTMKIPPAVIACERRRLIELLVFEHKKRAFHFFWLRKDYLLANVYYRFFLDSFGMMTLLLVVCFSMSLCVCLENYFQEAKFCDMHQRSLTWSNISQYLWVMILAFGVLFVWNAFSVRKWWHIENKRYPFLIKHVKHVCLSDGNPDCGNRVAQSAPGHDGGRFRAKITRVWKPMLVYWHGCAHFGVSRVNSLSKDESGPYGQIRS